MYGNAEIQALITALGLGVKGEEFTESQVPPLVVRRRFHFTRSRTRRTHSRTHARAHSLTHAPYSRSCATTASSS